MGTSAQGLAGSASVDLDSAVVEKRKVWARGPIRLASTRTRSHEEGNLATDDATKTIR